MTATTVRGTTPARQSAAKPKRGSLSRLRRTRLVLAVAALVFGAVGVWTVQSRSDGAHDALKHSGPLVKDATDLYVALSDADATAATIYLHTGLEPPQLDKDYKTYLDNAAKALTSATAEAHGAADSIDQLNFIADKLPQYSALIGFAESNNRLGFPLGTRYLLMASNVMQTGDPTVPGDKGILEAAKSLVDTEKRNLVKAQDKASAVPVVEIAAGAALLLALLYVQSTERRRTRRILNPGLVGATVALVVTAAWLGASFAVQGSEVDLAKKDGSDQVTVLAAAQVQSLQARTEEMLTLIGRGTQQQQENNYATKDEPALVQSLKAAERAATDDQGRRFAGKAVFDESAWNGAHKNLRAADQKNDYQAAVDSALGAKADDPTTADAAFTALHRDLDDAITHANQGLQTHSQSAADAVTGAAIGMAVLALLMAGAVVAGLGRRISEYQ